MKLKKLNKFILYFAILCGSISCAASEYKIMTIDKKDMAWRNCDEKDDKQYYRKGFCFITKKCKKVLLRKKCIRHTHFCKYGDEKCFDLWRLWDKVLR